MSQRAQVQVLARGVAVLVATPGRLLDLGFIVPLKRIVRLIPAKRQTLFFSATMPKTISQLADSLLSDPHNAAALSVTGLKGRSAGISEAGDLHLEGTTLKVARSSTGW